MKKKLSALTALVLISGLCYSQNTSIGSKGNNTYPKEVVINGDTVCEINDLQVGLIDETYLSLDECNSIRDSLNKAVTYLKNIVATDDEMVVNLDHQVGLQDSLYKKSAQINAIDEKQAKKDSRRIAWLRIKQTVLVAALAGVLVLYALHK